MEHEGIVALDLFPLISYFSHESNLSLSYAKRKKVILKNKLKNQIKKYFFAYNNKKHRKGDCCGKYLQ